MARFEIAGHVIEMTTPGEMSQIMRDRLADHASAKLRTAAEGKKYMRLNPPVTGQAVAGKLVMGGDFITGPAASGGASPGGQAGAPSLQPRAGYCWAVRRASLTGLANGTTPDVVNLFRGMSRANAWLGGAATLSGGVWQFNGNNFAYTFSFGELIFLEGETPVLASQGAFASTAQVTFDMDFIEVPQPLLWKVLG